LKYYNNKMKRPGLVKLSKEIISHVSIERISDELRKAQKHVRQFIECSQELGFLRSLDFIGRHVQTSSNGLFRKNANTLV